MRPEQLGPTGVMIQQLKTGVTQIKEWNDDVEAWAIEATTRYEGIKQRLAEQGNRRRILYCVRKMAGSMTIRL